MTDSTTIRIPLLAAAALLLAAPRATAPLPQLRFHGVFFGVAADGERCVWQGRVDGPVSGRVTIALRQVEDPTAAANPVWHVASRWTVSDDGAAHSFVANLEGMIDWRSGTIRLAGPITEGWSRGSWAEVSGRFAQGDVTGSVTVSPPRSRE